MLKAESIWSGKVFEYGSKGKVFMGEKFIIITLTFELLLFVTKLEPHKNSPN